MAINGNDIRTLNRVPFTDLMDVVVAIYRIAYRERYAAGKKIERFVNDEKEKRVLRRVGFSDVTRCLVKIFLRSSVLDSFKECWNRVVDSLDADFFESIRCVKIEEFMETKGEYTVESETINSVSTDTVDVQMCEGFLDTLVNYTRRKYVSRDEERVGSTRLLQKEAEKDMDILHPTESIEADAEEVVVEPITSKKKRKESVYGLHKVMATCSVASTKELAVARKEPLVKTCSAGEVIKMPGDGHCLFWLLGYHLGLTAIDMRRELWKLCTNEEKEEMPFVNIFDGSFEGLGKADCLRVFSRGYGLNACVHGVMDGKPFITEAYSHEQRYERTIHLVWTVPEKSGHVDVIREIEVNEGSALEQFLLDHDLHVPLYELDDTIDPIDAVHNYVHEKNLKRFSITRDYNKMNRYINRSAYKLREIVKNFSLELGGKRIGLELCVAPDGFVQVWRKRRRMSPLFRWESTRRA